MARKPHMVECYDQVNKEIYYYIFVFVFSPSLPFYLALPDCSVYSRKDFHWTETIYTIFKRINLSELLYKWNIHETKKTFHLSNLTLFLWRKGHLIILKNGW